MKTELFFARKLYNNRVSVQSCVIEYAKRRGKKVIVDYNGERMLIENLDGYTCDGFLFTAERTDKYIKAGKQYKLYDYFWSPVEKEVKVEEGYEEDGLKKKYEAMRNNDILMEKLGLRKKGIQMKI